MGAWDTLSSIGDGIVNAGSAVYDGAASAVETGGRALASGAGYVMDGAAELGSMAAGLGSRAVDGIGDIASGIGSAAAGVGSSIYHGLTDWHFEDRAAHNGPAPSSADLADPSQGWEHLPPWMSVYHDNGVGAPEDKYINPDGRESVRDGDTGAEVTDPRYMATYNYVNPMSWDNVHGVGDAAEFAGRGVGHFAADILPYWIGGNVRVDG